MKNLRIIVGIVVAGLLLAPVVVPLISPWSRLNCWYEDINIQSGQARRSSYLWFLKVSEAIEDTLLSRALDGEHVEVVSDIEPWQRVNTFSYAAHHSPHYRFHGAFVQIVQLDGVFKMLHATAERKREIAKKLLTLWQSSGGDSGADEYIRQLRGEGMESLDRRGAAGG